MSDNCIIKNKNLKCDMLTEMFNIGVGKAASLLSEIIDKKIILDVSRIDTFTQDGQEKDLKEILYKVSDGTLMVSWIEFEDKITGEANLVFPTEKMRTFINLCVNQDMENIEDNINFRDIDFDIIKEVGNIVLNSIIGEISNLLNITLNYSPPKVKIFDKNSFKSVNDARQGSFIILLYVTFIIEKTEINGAIIIDLTLNSLNELIKIIEKMEDDLYE